MKKLLILSTGGTFNKRYDPLTGELFVDPDAAALHTIIARWLTDFRIQTLIGKDSLEMDDADRQTLLESIRAADESSIIVVHGTDTMEQSADTVAHALLGKQVVFTGAMVPFDVDPVEATANLASAIGWAQGHETQGVWIAMNGCFGPYADVTKDRSKGRFVCK
jgi:L-asparaginase